MTTLRAEPLGYPRMPQQQADVMPGSPLAILAIFTEIVRARFKEDSGLAWAWEPNPTPAPSEANTVGAPRKILIEPAFAENNETRNFRPAILIDKRETVPNKVAIGNFVGQQLNTGLRGFYSLATIPVDVSVISDQKGESAILADITWFYLLSGREQIRETFGFQEMTNPVLGRTVAQEADRRTWLTTISFTLEVAFRWSTLPISPTLREIVATYRAITGTGGIPAPGAEPVVEQVIRPRRNPDGTLSHC